MRYVFGKYVDRFLVLEEHGDLGTLMVSQEFTIEDESDIKSEPYLQSYTYPNECIFSQKPCGLRCHFCRVDFRKSEVRFMCIKGTEPLKFYQKEELDKQLKRQFPTLR